MSLDLNYIKRIYNVRHFLLHLVKWDMKYRFRRSKLGILWTILQPLLFTIILATVFSVVFSMRIKAYAPYILTGVLVWEVLLSAVITNSYSFIKSESYIRQVANPVIIYPMRDGLVSMLTFFIAIISLVCWISFVHPENLIVALISFPLSVLLLTMLVIPISIISAHIHVRYRDYPYVLGLLMQLLWYLSPVFFEESMFKANEYVHTFFLYNPVTSILMLIRAPFLYGTFPSLFVYGYVLGLIVIFSIIAYFVNKKCEEDVIFYL